MAQLTNEELQNAVDVLRKNAASLNHPLLPADFKRAIQSAAMLVVELVNRVRDLERRLDHAESNR